jgi:hypothetical protein
VKFILFVEGYTEKKALPAFLKRWLDSNLELPIGVQAVRFEGWAEFRKGVRKKAHLYLNGPQQQDILGVIGLLDLYGPSFYPGHLLNADDRNQWAKKDIEDEVNHLRFRQFFSVHEVEAWLLSQPDLFPPEVQSALPGNIVRPESVNFDQPPSKLLQQIYRGRLKQTYKKVTHGKDLFDRLDPFVAYQKCPNLRQLLDEMLLLAS